LKLREVSVGFRRSSTESYKKKQSVESPEREKRKKGKHFVDSPRLVETQISRVLQSEIKKATDSEIISCVDKGKRRKSLKNLC